mmetsp:Transcript_15346/g.14719  ORF Transcript_15346/g.14719 Transcript_15346/m.14719 type:complete len:404 (-) Transcript_15346:322-1533(-)|eukprot:CAMPEP_0119054056 /NCGR_PEP_ID=MMETSP1177-20130426/74820_1 /TAXON_ID=2985 /ORGANISM="Ochromonas sp, Strain CCMP1899" /LENGTH=403 /DNA_ID=CAMNT_0007034173 /DNA_START=2071 /DNA_END=3282 /DNA_ORIENTATION=-
MLKNHLGSDSFQHEIIEIQNNLRTSLEITQRRKSTISTANDVSISFHHAVNGGPHIDWSFAELVLERYSVLWTEELAKVDNDNVIINSVFEKSVWMNFNFESNLVKLLKSGDSWRVRKSLKFILQIVGDWRDYDSLRDLTVSVNFFESLASRTLQSMKSSQDDEEMKWVYLIRKEQKKIIPCDILRLINSFLYSRKKKNIIACNALRIISALVDEEISPKGNIIHFTEAPHIPKAIVQFLIEEKGNNDVVELCLHLAYALVTLPDVDNAPAVRSNFLACGIHEALISIVEMYTSNYKKISYAIYIIYLIVQDKENIPVLISSGVLKALVQVYNSPIYIQKEGQITEESMFNDSDRNCHIGIVERLCASDESAIEHFNELGIPEGSSFFGLFTKNVSFFECKIY